jgi:hypothetical protein
VAVTHQNCVREEIKNTHDRRTLAGIIWRGLTCQLLGSLMTRIEMVLETLVYSPFKHWHICWPENVVWNSLSWTRQLCLNRGQVEGKLATFRPRIFYILLTVHYVTILGKWPTWRTILFYVFTFIFNSLHVSGTLCSSSGETNCVNTTPGNCRSVSVAVPCAGRK